MYGRDEVVAAVDVEAASAAIRAADEYGNEPKLDASGRPVPNGK